MVSQFPVSDRIKMIADERTKNANDRDFERAEKQQAQRLARETQAELERTEADLASTRAELETMVARNDENERRANSLAMELDRVRRNLQEAQLELASWRSIGLPVSSIKGVIEDLKNARERIEAIEQENEILLRRNFALKDELEFLTSDQYRPPELPEGLRGNVVAVDPKYDFVVVNVGEEHGVVDRGELLVNREGRLVGKLTIVDAQGNTSIANVVPGWGDGDVMEGDLVVPSRP
ncbi:MAG TPA: hypothetical protein VMS21_00955 [Methylomirabilota bacterium]|nr:hypothetical protein [Methylomirabilota bacterium]